MIDSTSSQTSSAAPTTGPTPISSEVPDALGQLPAVVDRAGDAGERVVEGDQQRQRRERVEERVLADQVDHDVPDDRDARRPTRSRRRACGTAGGCGRTCAGARGAAPSTAPVRDAGMIVVWVDAIAEVVDREQHDPVPRAEHLGREQAEDELLLLGVLGQELGARRTRPPRTRPRRTCTSRMTVERIAGLARARWPSPSVSSVRLTADSQPQ